MIRRLALLLPVAILAALASLAPVALVVPVCAAAGSNHAAVVVEHGDGSVVTRCVAFDTDSISGDELLNRSGLAWSAQTFGSFGDAVCALDGEPAQYVECLGKDRYWAVFVARTGGSWQLASVGISTMTLHDGDAEGFRYVPASGVPTAPVSAAGVCLTTAVTPTATPTATSMAPPSTTPTRRPAVTAITATASSTAGDTTVLTDPPASAAAPVPTSTTLAATTSAAATTTATPPPQAPTPGPSGGTDLGLMAAAVAGGGLAGLALLRLFAVRAPPR